MESHLQALIEYFSTHPCLALGAVFAAALLEALAVVGTVIPGSSIVFVGGMLVGLNALDSWWTAAAAVSGAILGDGVSYWLGRHHHQRLRSMWPLKTHPEILERGQAYFAKNGGKSVPRPVSRAGSRHRSGRRRHVGHVRYAVLFGQCRIGVRLGCSPHAARRSLWRLAAGGSRG